MRELLCRDLDPTLGATPQAAGHSPAMANTLDTSAGGRRGESNGVARMEQEAIQKPAPVESGDCLGVEEPLPEASSKAAVTLEGHLRLPLPPEAALARGPA